MVDHGNGGKTASHPVFGEPVFNEATELPNPAGFTTFHTSDTQTYREIQELLKRDVVVVPQSRMASDELYTLAKALGARGADVVREIKSSGRITFHSVGDSGATTKGFYKNEIAVTDQLTTDAHTSQVANRPAFLFHLGDLVYSFGESEYYWDQFYDAFRNYPAPILAIPGNHDSFVVPDRKGDTPLTVFQRNFCAEKPVRTPEARSLHRTAMTQPGVYYAFDAPFVRIIALFSNALEDPGVISSEDGHWPDVTDVQLEFLRKQLERAKSEKYAGALLLAMHHPPFSYSPPRSAGHSGGNHSGNSTMLRQIDQIAKDVGIYPHAVLSGHAHNYQRYTRTVEGFSAEGYDVPFIICGNGGHHVNKLVQSHRGQPSSEPQYGTDVSYLDHQRVVDGQGLLLEKYDDEDFGYLRISVDNQQLRIAYHAVTDGSLLQSRFDLVTIDLASHTMVAN
ncbi:MAG TPA: metallophosphoesterase [Pirellulales bacterium]|jgi:hypothetical protein